MNDKNHVAPPYRSIPNPENETPTDELQRDPRVHPHVGDVVRLKNSDGISYLWTVIDIRKSVYPNIRVHSIREDAFENERGVFSWRNKRTWRQFTLRAEIVRIATSLDPAPNIDPEKEKAAIQAQQSSCLRGPLTEDEIFRLYGHVSPPERNPNPDARTATDILQKAARHIADRAAARDQPSGERSMGRTVTAFNAITGHTLSERDGWLFMAILKMARACNTPTGLPDDYEDGAAYFAFAGEAASRADR